jgi:hypothetical protein
MHPLTAFIIVIIIITRLVIMIKVTIGTNFGASNNTDKEEARRPAGLFNNEKATIKKIKIMNELEKMEP